MNVQTAQHLSTLALFGAPVVAGGISGKLALDLNDAKLAWRKGFRGTLIGGVVLGLVAGLVIDILHTSISPPGMFLTPAAVMLGALQVPVSGFVGLVVAYVCADIVHRRNAARGNRR